MNEPTTKAGRWLVDRAQWDSGMRGFFVRINATAGPDDMHRHVLAIEKEAREQALAEHDCFWDAQPIRTDGQPLDIDSLRMDVTDEEADAFLAAIEPRELADSLCNAEFMAGAHCELREGHSGSHRNSE